MHKKQLRGYEIDEAKGKEMYKSIFRVHILHFTRMEGIDVFMMQQ